MGAKMSEREPSAVSGPQIKYAHEGNAFNWAGRPRVQRSESDKKVDVIEICELQCQRTGKSQFSSSNGFKKLNNAAKSRRVR